MVGQVLRFLVVGGTNTIITYLILVGLALVIPFPAAYSVAFAIGLGWTLFGTTKFVFRSRKRWPSLALYLAWYLLVFGAGQVIIHILRPHGFWPVAATSFVILLVTTPLTFIGGRLIFLERNSSTAANRTLAADPLLKDTEE